MGLTHIRACVANPARPARAATLRFLVDSGAVNSIVPTTTSLESLGLILDPMKRVLRPLPMLLGQLRTRHE
jgi:hypothetical protein